MTDTAADLAATVRDALGATDGPRHPKWKAHRDLDALLARCEEAEAALMKPSYAVSLRAAEELRLRTEAAEAERDAIVVASAGEASRSLLWRHRAEAAEAERDALKEECADWARSADDELARAWKERALAAEAERDEARETNRVNSEMAVWKHELWKASEARVAELEQAIHAVVNAAERLSRPGSQGEEMVNAATMTNALMSAAKLVGNVGVFPEMGRA